MNSKRVFAFLGILAVSGCAGGTAPYLAPGADSPASIEQRSIDPASSATVFVSVPSINAIVSFPAGQANPRWRVATRDGIDQPAGIAVGGSGTLFVNNQGNNTVTEYPPGATKPSFTLSVPNGIGYAIAADSGDTLYVEDYNGNIDLYPPGATQPSQTLQNPGGQGPPYGLGPIAVDKANDVYVVGFGGACCGIGVFEYPGGSNNPAYVQYTNNLGGGIAVDGAGDLFVSPIRARIPFIRVIHPNGTVGNFKGPRAALMSFDAKDQYLYTTFGTVSIIDYKTKKVVGTLRNTYDGYGIAVRPAAF